MKTMRNFTGAVAALIAILATFAFADILPQASGLLLAFPAVAVPAALASMRKRHTALTDQMTEMLDSAAEEGRELSEDEWEEYNALKEQRANLNTQITEREDLEEERARLAEPATDPEGPEPEARNAPQVSVGANREAERPFNSLGEQLLAVAHAAEPGARVDQRLLRIRAEQRAASGLSEGVPSDGGFMVQKDFVTGIIERTYNVGQLLSRVDQLPLGEGKNGTKINAEDETSRADGSRAGGVRAYWANEADAFTGSSPKFRQMELALQKLIGLVYATDELLQDATALGAYIGRKLPEELRFTAEDALVNGSGAGQPLGILNSPALITETGSGAAGTFTAADAATMYARFWARSRLSPGAAWIYDQSVEPQLPQFHFTVENAAGTENVGGFPANGIYTPAGANGNDFARLFGIDMIPVEYCAQLGTVGDVILADLMQYLFIAREIQAASSMHVRFLYDEEVFRFVWRVDGQPAWNSPLTPKSGGDTLSPFVALGTRS